MGAPALYFPTLFLFTPPNLPMLFFVLGLLLGIFSFLLLRYAAGSLYTVEQNERAVITNFGRAQRLDGTNTLDGQLAQHLEAEQRSRYSYPALKVVGPGGPYLKLPWQRIHKVNVAIQTVNIAYDPENSEVNEGGTRLDAVTKDQLNIGITGQLRYRVCSENLYAFLFGVKRPIAHVMGYFISVLRERIANFEAPDLTLSADGAEKGIRIEGVSINDLRKNLNSLNAQMDQECLSSAARYGIIFDASLITGIDPPTEIETALAAINTAHNEVGADLSVAQAMADQKIEQSKRAVEIETMRAEAEVEPLRELARRLGELRERGEGALEAYLRNARLDLLTKARRVIRVEKQEARP
jgi:regulator of protease activity HflC (stomatin/prohibitin superfamily)